MGAKRVVKILLQSLFLWVPLGLALLSGILLLVLWLYLTPSRMEHLVTSLFNERSNGSIQLDVISVNPYSGFDIKNIVIRSGPDFNNDVLARIARLRLRYDFFSLFLGDVHVHEVGVYGPELFIRWKDDHWNVETLMKTSAMIQEEPEEIKEEPLEDIELPINAELLVNMVLEDLAVTVNGPSYSSSLENFSASAKIWLPPFKKIPVSLEAVSLLETMDVQLNPKETLDLSFYSDDATVDPPLLFTWRLRFDRGSTHGSSFLSMLKLGTYRAPVRFKRTHLVPMKFLLSYDLQYNPDRDRLNLYNLTLSMKNRKWISLEGKIEQVTGKQKLNVHMVESDISLNDVYPYYRAVTGDTSTAFGGRLSLFPFSVTGTMSTLNMEGSLKGRNIELRQNDNGINIPRMNMPFTVNKRGSNIAVSTRLLLPGFFYTLERSRSGENALYAGARLTLLNNMQSLVINDFSLRHYDPGSGNTTLKTGIKGNIDLSPDMKGSIQIASMVFDRNALESTLTNRLKESLKPLKLKEKVTISSGVHFVSGAEKQRVHIRMDSAIPDYEVTDLVLDARILHEASKKKISLEKVHLSSKSRKLSIDCNGMVELEKEPFSDSNISVTIRMNSPAMRPVYDDWKMSGLVKIDGTIRGNLENGMARGKILVDNVNVKNAATLTDVAAVYLDFPFEYHLNPEYTGKSLLVVKKSDVINNSFFQEKDNLKIRSIRSRHPARDIQFEYLKDLSGRIQFRENVLEISSLRAYVLDGSLYGKDILFNLADMKARNMEYQMIMDITNMDIARLDEPDPKRKEKGGELSMNANLSGRGIDFSRELDVKGSVHIYEIGDRFANQLLTGLNEEKGKSKLGIGQVAVDNSLRVKSFDFNLDRGLIYATVHFQRNLFGYTISVKDEEVKYDRVPVQEFLRKVREGE